MKALVKNELRLTRKILLIWMGIVLILCGFAYFEYLSLKDSLNELTGLISDFPKILKAMFGVSGDLTSALGWYGCMYYWATMLTNSYAVYLGVSCIAKEQAQGTAEYLFTKPVSRSKVVCAKAVACICNLFALAVFSGLCNYFTAILPLGGLEQGEAVFTTTLGLLLTGVTLFAITLLASSLTRTYKGAVRIEMCIRDRSRSIAQTVSRPSHCGVRFAQVEERTTSHTRVTQQAESVMGSGGRRSKPFLIWEACK